MSADTDLRGCVGLPQPLTMRFHTWKCDGWTSDGHYPCTLQPARADCVFQWVTEEDGRPSAPWYSPLLHGSSGSCSSPPSHPGTVPIPCLLAEWLAGQHPLNQSGELTLSHIQSMYMTFFLTLFTGFVQTVSISE